MFWAMIASGFAGAVGLGAWLVFANRYHIEMWWYRRHLSKAMAADEAKPWVEKFGRESGFKERCSIFWQMFLQGDPRADYWILTEGGHPLSEKQLEQFVATFFPEARVRPEICSGLVHILRWQVRDSVLDGTEFLDEASRFIAQGAFGPDGEKIQTEEAAPLAYFVRILCWATSKDDLCEELEMETWQHVFARWRDWYEENGPYLTFDPDSNRYVLDEAAKAARRPVAASDRLVPAVESPLPNWTGPIPE